MNRKDMPTLGKLIYSTTKGLKELGGSGTIDEIFDSVVSVENFPADGSKDLLNMKIVLFDPI